MMLMSPLRLRYGVHSRAPSFAHQVTQPPLFIASGSQTLRTSYPGNGMLSSFEGGGMAWGEQALATTSSGGGDSRRFGSEDGTPSGALSGIINDSTAPGMGTTGSTALAAAEGGSSRQAFSTPPTPRGITAQYSRASSGRGMALTLTSSLAAAIPAIPAVAGMRTTSFSAYHTLMSTSAFPPASATASGMERATSDAVSDSLAGGSSAITAVGVEDEDEELDEYEASCGVCFDDGGHFITTQPCNHKICVDCASELVKLHPLDPIPCPFCRAFIRGFGLHNFKHS